MSKLDIQSTAMLAAIFIIVASAKEINEEM